MYTHSLSKECKSSKLPRSMDVISLSNNCLQTRNNMKPMLTPLVSSLVIKFVCTWFTLER